ncbi:adhesion G-protein coupled receptor F1 [Polymixia lowei]
MSKELTASEELLSGHWNKTVVKLETFIAEILVESNVTLEAVTVLSVLNTSALSVTTTAGPYDVTITQSELVAECLLVGDDSNCSCSTGYIWSNAVCYDTTTCCNNSNCYANVSHYTPLCIAKVNVRINGSVEMQMGMWTSSYVTQLTTSFQDLNGFEGLNITGLRDGDIIADFEVFISVKFDTSRLLNILATLETALSALIQVDTSGMVDMESPVGTLCYRSTPVIKCTFIEATDHAGWNMSRRNERFELNTGSVVSLNYDCATADYQSCTAVTLNEVTGNWAGKYNSVLECGFTKGSVRHTAKTVLTVALLPDDIIMSIDPLTGDCSEKAPTEHITVKVTAMILNTTEIFDVTWTYLGVEQNEQLIPTAGRASCIEEELNGAVWPKSPSEDTVLNRTCERGRVGYMSRTCSGGQWLDVFAACVNEELNKIVGAADNFNQGLGATQEVAETIFAGLKNNTGSGDAEDMADLTASIAILNIMASASGNVELQEEVFPDFVDAASSMLNSTWAGVNNSIKYAMSSNYLESVEGLVKNIKVNTSDGFNTENLELKFCKPANESDCGRTVFGVDVNLNKTSGVIKSVAVKNLVEKLRNNFANSVPNSLLVSTTVSETKDTSIDIVLDFPNEDPGFEDFKCVFWNTTTDEWSTEGCESKRIGNRTVCHCNHLTSFAVLMSKHPINLPFLDEITYVGLGVSICSLLLFLIIEAMVWSAVVKSNLSLFRHTALVNISLCLFLADCSFLASTSPEILSATWCLTMTVLKHFFFLGMFGWMLCLSVMLVHQLIFVFSPLRKRVFMFLSSIVGYVCPILIVGSTFVYYKYTKKDYYNKKTCWLTYESLLIGSMHAFILPVGIVVFTNLFSMVVVIVTLVKSSIPDGSKADKDTAKSIMKVIIFLTPVFGVTWVFGFIMLMLDSGSPMYTFVIYGFTILNSFQGFFILVTGCFAEQRVREEVLKIIMSKVSSKDDGTKTTTANSKAR